MRKRIYLSPRNTSLEGKYPPWAEHVHIVLDSTDSAFAVTLPDVRANEQREFVFYNVPASGLGFAVTLQSKRGQYIYQSDSVHILGPGDTVSFVANLSNHWLITDVNRGSIYGTDQTDTTPPVEGNWRTVVIGTDLHNQRYESGAWVTKSRSTAQSDF